MTLITRVAGTPDATLPPVVPSFGLSDLTHFWHPRAFATGQTSWPDSIASLALAMTGDGSVTGTTENGRPVAKTTTTAGFQAATAPAAEIRTLILVGKVATADAVSGTGYILHNGAAGMSQAGSGSTTVAGTASAPSITGVALDKYHMYAISQPSAGVPTYVVDQVSSAGTTTPADPSAVRVGVSSTNRRAMTVAAVLACTSAHTASELTGTVYPLVRQWFRDLPW